jgi:pilus assembly protein TadC
VTGLTPLIGLCVAVAVAPWWCADRPRVPAVTARRGTSPPAATRASPVVDVVVVLALLDAAVASGAGLPRALSGVGRAIGGDDGRALVDASAALVMGARWETAWSRLPDRMLPVAACLVATWSSGAAPGPALRTTGDRLLRERRTTAREAAARLGVRLVLPLGLCFLPAFVLIGLVPVLVSVGAEVVR